MNKWNDVFLVIFGTILVLSVSLLLPSTIALIITVAYFSIVAWWKPKLLFLALIIYFPVRPFLVEVNDGLKLAGDIGIIVLLFRVLTIAVKERNYPSIFKLEWYEWAYLLFCIIGAISALFTGVTIAAIIFQLRKFLMMYLLYYGMKRLPWEKRDIFPILKLVAGMAIFLSIHGYIEKLSQRQWLLPQAWMEQFISPTNAERIYGLIGNPNSLALFMIIAIVSSLVLLLYTKERRWYFPLVISVGTLLLTMSRGALLGLLIAGIVFFIVSRKASLLKPVLISAFTGFFLVFIPISISDSWIANVMEVEQNEGTETENDKDGNRSIIGKRIKIDEETVELSSNTGRLFYVKKGLEIFKDYPVIGTGFGTFGDSATLVYSSPIYEDYGLANIYDYRDKGGFYSDNQYIQIIVQTGSVGVLLFAVFLLNLAYRFWKTKEINVDLANIAVFFWVYICVVGVVYNVWENQVFPMFFFALIALVEVVRKRNIFNKME